MKWSKFIEIVNKEIRDNDPDFDIILIDGAERDGKPNFGVRYNKEKNRLSIE